MPEEGNDLAGWNVLSTVNTIHPHLHTHLDNSCTTKCQTHRYAAAWPWKNIRCAHSVGPGPNQAPSRARYISPIPTARPARADSGVRSVLHRLDLSHSNGTRQRRREGKQREKEQKRCVCASPTCLTNDQTKRSRVVPSLIRYSTLA